jgi:hypothetical protein
MRAGILLACNTGGVVSQRAEWPEIEKKLQVLDVGVVDMLSHLEALLRQSHLIQRALLQLRSEAPPPPPQNLETVDATLIGHADEMYREWAMLGDIIRDFKTGIRFSDESEVSEQRSGLDRRYAQHSVAPELPRKAPKRGSQKESTGPRGRRGKTGPTGAAGPAGAPGHDHRNEIALLSAQVAELVSELQSQLTRIAQLQAQADHSTLGQGRPAPRKPARTDN